MYQPTGTAVIARSTVDNLYLVNNLFWVDQGYALSISADSTVGFRSDYNLFDRTTLSSVGLWTGAGKTDLAAWRTANGQDSGSLEIVDTSAAIRGQFMDIDGADNVFGGLDGPTGGGQDDNFGLRAYPPAIDRANSYVATFTDILGKTPAG